MQSFTIKNKEYKNYEYNQQKTIYKRLNRQSYH